MGPPEPGADTLSAAIVVGVFYLRWVQPGRPGGIQDVEAAAEAGFDRQVAGPWNAGGYLHRRSRLRDGTGAGEGDDRAERAAMGPTQSASVGAFRHALRRTGQARVAVRRPPSVRRDDETVGAGERRSEPGGPAGTGCRTSERKGAGMSTSDAFRAEVGGTGTSPASPGGLLDVLSLAAVVLDDSGRIVLWSPQAEELFGYSADEALGQFAGPLLVDEQHLDLVIGLFARVMESGRRWAGGFPVKHKDGSTRLVEFRNMRLQDDRGGRYALGIATDQVTLRRLEQDLALSLRLISQSPIGLGVMDTELRFVLVNPALEGMHGSPAADHAGPTAGAPPPFLRGTPSSR